MSISSSDINRVIQLAHLALPSESVDRFSDQVRGIIGHMAVLSEAPIEGIDPTDPNLPSTPTVLDQIDDTFGDCTQANSEYLEGPFFVVPKISGGDSE